MNGIPSLTPPPEQLDAIHRQLLTEEQEQRHIDAVQEVCGAALSLADSNPAGALDILLTALGTLASAMDKPQRDRAALVLRSFSDYLEAQ